MAYPAIRRRRDNVLQRLFQRPGVAVAGRDGTLAQSGATGSTALHPTTGAVVSAGALISHNLPINGAGVLPMSFAQGARTNLCPVSSGAGVGLLSNTLSGLSRTITESSGVSDHYVSTTVGADIPDLTTHILHAIVSRKPGSPASRHAVIQVFSGANSGAMVVNLDTGIVTLTSAGTVTASAGTSTPLGGGRYRVSCLISSTNFGASQALLLGINENGSSVDVNFNGDGLSGVVYEAVTLEAATFSGLGLAEGATRAADNILWTPPSALSTTSGEVVAVAAPYLWGSAAGAALPLGTNGIFWYAASGNTAYRILATGRYALQRSDSGSQSASSSTDKANTSGQLDMCSSKWDASALSLYSGASLLASDATLSPPWTAQASMSVGSIAAVAASHCFVGLIYVPNGLTDAERAALARLTAGSITYVG